MREFSIIGTIAINLFILVRYCTLIHRGRIRPSLAMWLFFSIAVGGTLITYLSEGEYGLLDNILCTSDLVLVSTITVCILLFGDRSTRFNRFDTGCLFAVLGILLFWALTQHHTASNLSIQAILVIAYFPVVRRLWNSGENTESYAAWIGLMAAPILSLISSRGMLATLYASRAIVSSSGLLVLMLRADRKTRERNRGTRPDPAIRRTSIDQRW